MAPPLICGPIPEPLTKTMGCVQRDGAARLQSHLVAMPLASSPGADRRIPHNWQLAPRVGREANETPR